MRNRAIIGMAAVLAGMALRGATVHVVQQVDLGGAIATFGETLTVEAGTTQISAVAPAKSGYIFTHWTISVGNSVEVRDALGRANDAVEYVAYDDNATLTAHYVPVALDEDGDGLADGSELYWYGTLDNDATSDTDEDGFNFAAELAAGTSPLMYDFTIEGGVLKEVGDQVLYNPKDLSPYIVRSDPEGMLFETVTNYVNVGTTVALPVYSRSSSALAYWSVNGVRQTDALGRSEDNVSFVMPNHMVECVARCETDAFAREQLYWYGNTDAAADSDTDGDGFTLEQEIAAGTNPLLYDYALEGGVLKSESSLTLYNAKLQSPYVVRSDPEGALVVTATNYVIVGTMVTLPTVSGDSFAYWMIDGVPQRDELGRALESVSFRMPNHTADCVAVSIADSTERAKLYWYGRTDVSMDDDTDGDGFTFAQEIAAGTNPHLVDYTLEGGVLTSVSEMRELDLQKYEQAIGALVEEEFVNLFTSPLAGNAAMSQTFANGTQIWPVVADVNDDGLWDLIVVSETTTNVFVNVGSKGNPQFSRRSDVLVASEKIDLLMNSTAKLAAMALDVEPVAALSATTNGATLLVSDVEGRIWLYEGTEATKGTEGTATSQTSQTSQTSHTSQTFSLKHKVWGGSYPGFANGLRLAAVDWEDDGDLDCLCGTAEGKLMLLRDPKVGRPTGLVAAAGVDNVKLDWEPNGQSRVRGYRVYRASGEATSPSLQNKDASSIRSDEDVASPTTSGVASPFALRASTALPTYRDTGLAPATYAYKVSALSRFYTAGNSTPVETESVATEPVTATVGGPTITIGEPVKTTAGKIEIVVSINNSMNYQAAGTTIEVPYDATKMGYLKTLPSGLSERLTWTAMCGGAGVPALPSDVGSSATNAVTIAITAGEVAAGSGVFFTLVFDDLGVERPILMGDLDGDGDVDVDDLRLLAKLKNGARKYTDHQLKAGDFNGNGKLDNADYQALRELLVKLGVLQV